MKAVDYPVPVRKLVERLRGLPGIGPRSAERLALWLLRSRDRRAEEIAESILEAREAVKPCPRCGFFMGDERCVFCADETRDRRLLCVVEQPTDILPLEKTGAFRGQYFTLGGKLSPLDRVSPEDLHIPELQRRVEAGELDEVILALSSDVEGEATAHYLAGVLGAGGVRLTRIAQGIPVGGGLEHSDEVTLSRALAGRTACEPARSLHR